MKRQLVLCCSSISLILFFIPCLARAQDESKYAKVVPEWNQPVKPFRIIGNIYYVGASEVSSFLITTPKGHILLDSGFAETVPLIKESILRLGFRLEDVKILINSHGHYDHAAGLALLKEMTGAKLYASEQEAELIRNGGKGDLQWGDTIPYRPANVDQILRDKDKVELGDVTMTARLTPGHTRGCTTWTMMVKEDGKPYDVVFVGSVTAPGYKLVGNPKYPNINDDFAYTFRLLKSLPCDVFLGPHGSFFALRDKAARLARGEKPNPFIDRKNYRDYLQQWEKHYLALLKKQQAEKSN